MDRSGFEFSFNWLFVLLVGISIISLALYASLQFSKTGEESYSSQVASQLGRILSPIETSVEG